MLKESVFKYKSFDVACLIPAGSSYETLNGISHLYEHILIKYYYQSGLLAGMTKEDYILFYLEIISLQEFISLIKQIVFDYSSIEKEKCIIYNEISMNHQSGNEKYFQTIWHNTIYEKSPLGTVREIENISIRNLMKFNEMILRMPMIFYTKNGNMNIINREAMPIQTHIKVIIIYRECEHKNRKYDVFYWNNEIERILLYFHIMKMMNVGKHVQLSDKKEMSALIMEKQTRFPGDNEIKNVIDIAKLHIIDKYEKMNSFEKAMRELECMYFFNNKMTTIMKKLKDITINELICLKNELIEAIAR